MITSRGKANFSSTDVNNLFCLNTREQKMLESRIKKLSSTARFQMNKINREMLELRKQLMENQKILGTRSDIRTRTNLDFTSEERLNLRAETPQAPIMDGHRVFRAGRRRHTISDLDTVAYTKSYSNINSTRFVTRRLSSSSSEDMDEKKISFDQPSSYSFSRRRQSVSTLPSHDKALCNRGENSARALGLIQNQDGTGRTQTERDNKKERPVTSRWSRRNSSPCSSSFAEPEKKFRETKYLQVTPSLGAQTKAQKVSVHDSKPLGVQTQQNSNLVFKRRHSTPNYMLPLNREQRAKIPSVKTRSSRGSVDKLTAKLPTRVSSARLRDPVVYKNVTRTIKSIEAPKPPTTVEEKTEIETDDEGEKKELQDENNEDNLKEVLNENQDKEEHEEKDTEEEQETSGYGDHETKTPPDELSGIPKITLAEKMEKFFAGAIEIEVTGKISGHYAEVLELYLSEKEEN